MDPYGDPYDGYATVTGGWYSGFNLRAGYALNRILLYAKAGIVRSNTELGFVDTCTVAPCGNGTINASTRADWGYQLGAGAEYALADRWALKAEYLFVDFGKKTIEGTNLSGGSAGTIYRIETNLSGQTLKVGMNYKF